MLGGTHLSGSGANPGAQCMTVLSVRRQTALPAPFEFERDTFAFANELVWQYRFDPATAAMTVSRNHPPPTYSHRCFVVVRSARQFLYHARFEPGLPAAETEVYRRLIRQVVSRNPRRMSAAPGTNCDPGL